MAGNEKQSSTENFNSTANLTSNKGFQSTLSIASKDLDNEKTYNPFEHRNLKHPNSTIGTLLHLLKACLGSGVLAMPAAFKNAGLATGIVLTILSGLVCTHTVYVLVRVSQCICVEAKKPSLSFSETCGAVFTYGPKRLRGWSNFAKLAVDWSLATAYASVLCVYVVFIGSSFKEVFDPYFVEYNISIQVYCALTLVPLVIVCQIRNLKYLVPFSAFANMLVLVVFGITMYYMFTDIPSIKEREMVASISTWPLFLSTAVFAMEGIGVVIPIENEMAHPQKFLGCAGVLNTSMVTVITFYGIFGFFGYLKYGDAVKGSITLNLPQDDIVAQVTKLLMALVIFFTYTLQFYVPMEVIQRFLKNRQSTKYKNVIQVSIRTIIVTGSVCVAVAFPNLELVISLVGAIFFSTLGLFAPAVIELVYSWDRDLGKFNYIIYKDVIIIIISIIALVSGSYASISGMIEERFESSHQNTTLI